MDITLVIPVFNEEDSLPDLTKWIHEVMVRENFSYEIIFIDDGSKDNTWSIIKQLASEYEQVRGLSFLRNFGKSAALNEGFNLSNGDIIITMDADLQDSPEEIPEFYQMLKAENYDLVSGWKKKRYDPITKTIPTKLFNWVTSQLTGIKLHDFNCGLKAYTSQVVKNIEVYGEMHRYIPVIAKWAGFTDIGEKIVNHRPRKYGASKFGIERFTNGFLDLLSILFVSRFSKKPMHLFGTLGTFTFIFGALVALWIIGEKVMATIYHYDVREVVDRPLFFLALTAIVIGAQLFLAGFLAELISRNQDPSERNAYAKKDKVRID